MCLTHFNRGRASSACCSHTAAPPPSPPSPWVTYPLVLNKNESMRSAFRVWTSFLLFIIFVHIIKCTKKRGRGSFLGWRGVGTGDGARGELLVLQCRLTVAFCCCQLLDAHLLLLLLILLLLFVIIKYLLLSVYLKSARKNWSRRQSQCGTRIGDSLAKWLLLLLLLCCGCMHATGP